jgi:hypothetical protein
VFWVDFDEAAGQTISNETGSHHWGLTLRASSTRVPPERLATSERSNPLRISLPLLLTAATALIEWRISIDLYSLPAQVASRSDASLRPAIGIAASNVDEATMGSSGGERSSVFEVALQILSAVDCCFVVVADG